MLSQKGQQPTSRQQLLPPPAAVVAASVTAAAGAVENNKWGLDEAEINAVFSKLQVPPRPATREASVLLPGQMELTEDDLLGLARIQQREAEGRTRKVTYGSELHPAVVGHNRSEQKHTQRLLKQWFFEERYQVDKVSNAQRATYRQLCLLHVDRRRQARELMNYRREEARAEVERERDRQRRAKELALLEKQIERLRQEEAMERATSPAAAAGQKLAPLLRRSRRKTVKGGATVGSEAAVAAVAAATGSESAASLARIEESVAAAATQRHEQPEAGSQLQAAGASADEDIVTMTAKVVEVDRRGMRAARQGSGDMAVLERSRSKSFVREPTLGTKPAAAAATATAQEMPQPQSAIPTDSKPTNKKAVAFQDATLASAPQAPATPLPPPPPPQSEQNAPPALTQVERNRLRARRKEEASRQLLQEPYRHYRLIKGGEIEPVEFLPPRFPTTEPSNRPLYEQHKRLEREKAGYVASMNRLGQFTAEMLNESIRLADAFEHRPKEKPGASGPPKEIRLGPTDWVKVFIRTNAPEEVEPGSFEAMKYVEYLRPEAPNTDRDLEVEKIFEDL